MKKLRKFLIPAFLILIIGALIFLFIQNYDPYDLSNIQKDPAAQLEKSLVKTKETMQSGLIMTPTTTVQQALKEGVVDVVFRSDEAKWESSLYLRDDAFTLTGSVPSGESNVDYTIWAGENHVAISVPEIFGKTVYGFSPISMKEDLKDSALLDLLGISYEDAAKLLDFLLPSENTEKANFKELLKLKRNMENLLKSCAVSVTEQTVTVDTGDVTAYQVSYTLAPEQLYEALDMVVNWMEESGSLELADITDFRESVEKLKAEIREYNATTIFDFFLHTDTQVIMKVACRMDWLSKNTSSSICVDLMLGENPKDAALYSLNISVSTPLIRKQEYSIQYQRSDAHNLPNRKLVLSSGEDSYTLFDLRFNALSDTFDLYLFDDSISLSGSYTVEKEVVTINLLLKDLGSMEVCFRTEATPPKLPSYTNICKLPEDRLLLLWEDIFGKNEVPSVWDISVNITDLNGAVYMFQVSGNYATVGEMLVAEGLATLDENGTVISAQGGNIYGEVWTVYVQGELIDGSLYDIPMESEMTILILAGTNT